MDDFNLNIPQITTDELEAKLKHGNKLELIDVREPNEYAAGHIEQAKNVPLTSIDQYQGAPDEDVYVICRSGRRSQRAAELLTDKRYHAINVADGMNLWTGKTVE